MYSRAMQTLQPVMSHQAASMFSRYHECEGAGTSEKQVNPTSVNQRLQGHESQHLLSFTGSPPYTASCHWMQRVLWERQEGGNTKISWKPPQMTRCVDLDAGCKLSIKLDLICSPKMLHGITTDISAHAARSGCRSPAPRQT